MDGLIRAIVAGNVCLDITPEFSTEGQRKLEDIFIPGKLVVVQGAQLSTGGAVSNTGIALSIMGVPTRLIGKIGRDLFGEGVRDIFRRYGAETGLREIEGERTSYSVVIAPPGCDRIFIHDPGANNTLASNDINENDFEEASLLHFGYPPIMRRMYLNGGDELLNLFKRAKDRGVTTSLDMCMPDAAAESGRVDWDALLRRVLPFVDIFAPSIEEILFMVWREEFERLSHGATESDPLAGLDPEILPELGGRLLDYGAKIVILKCGTQGLYIRTQSKEVIARMGRAAPRNVENWGSREFVEGIYQVSRVVSATGAGDCSIAGFLAGLLNGRTIENSMRLAAAAGALCVQAYDACSGMKSIGEMETLIEMGWKKDPRSLRGENWRFSGEQYHWVGRRDHRF